MHPIIGFLDRPSTGTLTLATIVVLIGFGWNIWMWWSTRPGRITPGPDVRPSETAEYGVESPAIVGLITGGFEAPISAVTATVLDLASAGWLRLTSTEGELVVVTSGRPGGDDVMSAYEQQVFNHISSRAFNDYTSAGTLAVSRRSLNMRWQARFRRSVANSAQRRGLSVDRYPAATLLVSAGAGVLALLVLLKSIVDGTEVAVADSMWSRTFWFVVVGLAIWLLQSTLQRYTLAAQVPTDAGIERAHAWLGYRQRLADRIPANASVIGNSKQQRALADATVMGVASHIHRQIPIVRTDPRRGWSEAGGVPHVVSIHYPVRPGYGQNPIRVAIVGVVGVVVLTWVRGYLGGVANGTRLTSVLDNLPGGTSIVEDIAEVLQIVLWLPFIPLYWCAFAGLIDTAIGRRVTGAVVRSRPPDEVLPQWLSRIVKPFGSRGNFVTYLAVDDGSFDVVVAAIADQRTAAPQGAQARIVVTPLLGYISSTEPVGTAGNPAEHGPAGAHISL